MKNRAKCKLCLATIESFHANDHVLCKCGEIELNGGDAMYCKAKDFANFLRVDDLGKEIPVKYQRIDAEQEEQNSASKPQEEITAKELVDILDSMIDADEKLPDHAKAAPLSTYDLTRYMLLMSNIIKRLF